MNDKQLSALMLMSYTAAIAFFVSALISQMYTLGVAGYVMVGVGFCLDLYRNA